MRRFLLLFLFSCSIADLSENKQQADVTYQSDASAPSQSLAPTESLYDASSDRGDVCIRDEFTADQIPSNYVIDWSCPPKISDPPRWIPPWDPSPIIKK